MIKSIKTATLLALIWAMASTRCIAQQFRPFRWASDTTKFFTYHARIKAMKKLVRDDYFDGYIKLVSNDLTGQPNITITIPGYLNLDNVASIETSFKISDFKTNRETTVSYAWLLDDEVGLITFYFENFNWDKPTMIVVAYRDGRKRDMTAVLTNVEGEYKVKFN